jgi:hypothetical protein
MTATALMVLIVSLSVVWGGLVASALYLRRHPEEEDAGDPGDVIGPFVFHDL